VAFEKNANDSNCSHICLGSLVFVAYIELLKDLWKIWQVDILFTVFSTNGNDGNIALVNEDLKNCL
jgi:hypothetical protein